MSAEAVKDRWLRAAASPPLPAPAPTGPPMALRNARAMHPHMPPLGWLPAAPDNDR